MCRNCNVRECTTLAQHGDTNAAASLFLHMLDNSAFVFFLAAIGGSEKDYFGETARVIPPYEGVAFLGPTNVSGASDRSDRCDRCDRFSSSSVKLWVGMIISRVFCFNTVNT